MIVFVFHLQELEKSLDGLLGPVTIVPGYYVYGCNHTLYSFVKCYCFWHVILSVYGPLISYAWALVN
mgnify:CR=1 FL=1